ncbi:MAG: HAD hydrolase-like protein [Gammaproteobacteria bacterium]|nr:HAD hydrolase-like protein [Gammaproteobacteria bacterium]
MPSPTIYFDLGETLITGPPSNRQPFSDAISTLQELYARGYQIGLLSDQADGTTVDQVNTRLDDFGFGQFIDPVTISSELPGNVFKPDPQIFALALQKAGHTTASSDTIFITETSSHITAARSLGWRGIVVKRNGGICQLSDGECVNNLDDLLALLPPLNIDLWYRDATDHTGSNVYSGSRFWDSPDLWIRNSDDNGTTHQSPEFGQDNFFHARIYNRGNGIVRDFSAIFEVKEWAGTNFIYPNDYLPFIASASGANLAPGESTVVKARWPAARIPPQDTHACWVSAILADRDQPVVGRQVWRHNNLAQKNLTIVNLLPGDLITIPFRVAHLSSHTSELLRIELHRPRKWKHVAAEFVTTHGNSVEMLWKRGHEVKQQFSNVSGSKYQEGAEVEFLSHTKIRLNTKNSFASTRLNLVPGSRFKMVEFNQQASANNVRLSPVSAELLPSPAGAVIRINPATVAGFTTMSRPLRNESLGLRLHAPQNSKVGDSFTIDVIERNKTNQIVGGIAVQVRIQK